MKKPEGMRILTVSIFAQLLANLKACLCLLPHTLFRRSLLHLLYTTHNNVINQSSNHPNQFETQCALSELLKHLFYCLRRDPTVCELFWGDYDEYLKAKESNVPLTGCVKYKTVPRSFIAFEIALDLACCQRKLNISAQEAILSAISFTKDFRKPNSGNTYADSKIEDLYAQFVGNFTAYILHYSYLPSIVVCYYLQEESRLKKIF